MDVHSYIVLSANAPNIGSQQFPPPEFVEGVRSLPKETTGLDRRYLEALQKNVTTRKHYLGLLHNQTEKPRNSLAPVQVTRLSDHVDLLRLRRRHQELSILQKSMIKLKQSEANKPDFLNLHSIKTYQPDSLHLDEQHRDAGGPQSYGLVDGLVRQLEVAVILANHQLDRERQLLSEIEEKAADLSSLLKQNNRLKALAATRDELVAWVEGKLASSSPIENGLGNEELGGKQTESPFREIHSEIMGKYENYLRARERMLNLILTMKSPTQPPPLKAQAVKVKSIGPAQASRLPTSSLLPFFKTQVRQPSHGLQYHRRQTTHLTTLIKKEHSKISSELSRLLDESHLIATYPVLARDSQFKHAAAAIVSRFSPSQTLGDGKENEMGQKVAAWTFAANAASQATEENVMEHLEKGRGAVKEGERWLGHWKEMLGSGDDLEQKDGVRGTVDAVKEHEEEDDDVWALEASAGPLNNKKHAVRHMNSPWAALRGDVGLRES